jgi:ABC-type branched-subunit amino acid transport system substrate-binding protein
LVVRDTQGEAPIGRAAVDELINDPTVGVVIGPLRSKVAEAVAPRAERAGLPMVVLSQQEGISGRWVVQPAMTAERQAAELAEYAVVGQSLRKLGVLYPNDQYGIALSTAFRQQVEKRGGRMIGSVTYEPSQREFSVELLSLDKWIKDDGLQAVFIPDFAPTAIPLAKQLRQAHPNVVLLGSNGWNDPAALGPAADDIDGAVFVDGFFASSQRPATQEFVAAYRTAYGGTPEILEAQAYDAAKLVAAALQGGARSRPQVNAALQTPRSFEGAAGTVAVGPQGIQRQLFLLRIASGSISEVVPSRPIPAPAPPPVPMAGQAAAP